jgi:hypothetical protein
MALALQLMHCQMRPQAQQEQWPSSSSSWSLRWRKAPCGGGQGHDDDLDLFFAVWLPRTIFETAWTITTTSFLGSTFGIANKCNTKDNKAKEEIEDEQWRLSTTHALTQNATWTRNIL